MTPELSRRGARAIQKIPGDKRKDFADAFITAEKFEDLPKWVQDLILQSEKRS